MAPEGCGKRGVWMGCLCEGIGGSVEGWFGGIAVGKDDDIDAAIFSAARGGGVGGDRVVLGVSGGGEAFGLEVELADEEAGEIGGAGGG